MRDAATMIDGTPKLALTILPIAVLGGALLGRLSAPEAGPRPAVGEHILLTGRAGACHDMHGTDLRGAALAGTALRDADLREANLEHADLRGACLDMANLAGARYDRVTRWPAGFRPRRRGAIECGRKT
jgi:Pentapeptide repeats (8 copies)